MFISHAGEEKPFARELRKSLGTIGIRAFLDQVDLQGGDHAVGIMLHSAHKAPIGLAVLSPAFSRKVWPSGQTLTACAFMSSQPVFATDKSAVYYLDRVR